ncbi:MAG: hypothetical protein IKE46_06610 [Selenomonadaceae bacterium]|nr:hypothetical protein [Selenomonadaceae bacterium]MBR3747663.1 hypothetical protein [Selenomonadaceae bacterium]
MGFRVKITGGNDVEFNEGIITSVEFVSDTPDTSNARSTDLGVVLKIAGRINFSLGAEEDDSTVELANWALMPSDQSDCYRNVQVQVVNGGQIVRQYTYPNAFVMDYTEDLNDDEGVGSFQILLKQKKDLTAKVELKGNFEE